MLSDSKIREWGAPSIHFKGSFECQPADRKESRKERASLTEHARGERGKGASQRAFRPGRKQKAQ